MKTTFEFPEPPEEPEYLSSLFSSPAGAPVAANTVPVDWVAAEFGYGDSRVADMLPEWLSTLPTSEATRREVGAAALPEWLAEVGADDSADLAAPIDSAETTFDPERPDEDRLY